MRVKRTLSAAALAATLAGGGAVARGQVKPAAPPPPFSIESSKNRDDKEKLRQEILDHMRAMRMWRITEELKLDEATAAKIFPLLARYDEQEQQLGKERGGLYRELKELVSAPVPDAARLSTAVDRLTANRTRRNQLEQEKFVALRRVLTPLQAAKLALLLPRIDEGFRRRIHETMRRPDGSSPHRHRERDGERHDDKRGRPHLETR